jgi:dihydroflavonol-4-reductase
MTGILRAHEPRPTMIAAMAGGTYFITGGFGFLGQHVVKAVRDDDPGGELRILVRTPRRTLLGVESMPGVRLVPGDLGRPETFAAALEGVDTVLHCAALVSFKRDDEEAMRRSNIVGTDSLLRAALDRRCRGFVFISSISAVGRQPGRLSDETMIPDLEEKRRTDFYGYSKLMGERALRAVAPRMRVIILNPSVLLGPGSRLLGRISSSLRWIPVLPMLATLNSFVDVRDAARAAVLALKRGRSGERYIVTAENVGMQSFARAVMAAMGRKVPVFPVPRGVLAFGDSLVRGLDALHLNPGMRRLRDLDVDKAYSAEKIRHEMGWRPEFSLEQSLRDTFSPAAVGSG